ncbi:multidrug transporter MatE [Sorangium cellulosum]|uniref:Multidrug-efflux transporter n=1 Tax=Sorangium cellulosum TaxID=56 RepID=A0A2L0EXC9_SORCE|nr:MATE family efflux transporter [Sorangium cellulosum]AUX43953.1 multidrug transporter MatE [Sorangium cellulosum]
MRNDATPPALAPPADAGPPSSGLRGGAGAWATLRDAVRGGEHDFTKGSIDRAIVLLAIPMVMEMLMESLFVVVDVFWVSRLGADAVAAVGLTESLLAVVYAVAMGLSVAASATVARRTGEGRPEEAAAMAGQAIVLGLLVSLPISAAGALLAPRLLAAMGATPAVIATGSPFAAIMLLGNATILMLFVINAAFRGAGDAALSMRVLWLSNALNMALGPCFIFGLGPFPELGVTGAAVATTLGRGTGVALQVVLLARGGGRLKLRARDLVPDPRALATLLRLWGSGAFQAIISTASWIGMVRIIAPFGSAALAGYTIGMRVVVFAILPALGLGNAAATMVGQNLGAGRPDRAEAAVYRAGLWTTAMLSAVGVVFVAAAGPIVGAFTSDPEVLRFGTQALRIIACGFLFYGFGIVFTQAFNGAGDTRTPTLLNFACFWLWEIPLGWALARTFGLGPLGVFIAIAVAFSTLAVAGWLMFRRGAWKLGRV